MGLTADEVRRLAIRIATSAFMLYVVELETKLAPPCIIWGPAQIKLRVFSTITGCSDKVDEKKDENN